MTQVWVGVSTTLTFRDLITQYIDPYFAPVGEDDEPLAEFVRTFGADPISPGDFEVYDDTNYVLGAQLFHDLCPFCANLPGLDAVDWPTVKAAFFVVSAATPSKRADENVTITDVTTVQFDWETE